MILKVLFIYQLLDLYNATEHGYLRFQNMIKFLIPFLLLFCNSLFADGLDEVKIYKNGQLIGITNDFIEKKFPVQVGDTLLFSVWTDWGGTMAGELEILNLNDSSKWNLKRSNLKKYEAEFQIVITQENRDTNYEFTYHFMDVPNIEVYRPWKFGKLEFN